jgi:hypothetical protein
MPSPRSRAPSRGADAVQASETEAADGFCVAALVRWSRGRNWWPAAWSEREPKTGTETGSFDGQPRSRRQLQLEGVRNRLGLLPAGTARIYLRQPRLRRVETALWVEGPGFDQGAASGCCGAHAAEVTKSALRMLPRSDERRRAKPSRNRSVLSAPFVSAWFFVGSLKCTLGQEHSGQPERGKRRTTLGARRTSTGA